VDRVGGNMEVTGKEENNEVLNLINCRSYNT